ncbi:uncharacterized protein P884DRAFT_289019, partial [Thermothelomyces heterothallicus CBS 202.75]|uniref:uncharacterized protein n=1 Tax=Thermothelomyces heterothallicus CBS 202.75 TaxID=1149848 RepID=UPI0037437BBC
MFITLRASGSQNEAGGGMEQVVRRGAAGGPRAVRDRTRQTRRPACVACQTKKLRCTGSSFNCDRCRARLIECVSPVGDGGGRQRTSSQPSNIIGSISGSSSSNLAWQKSGGASPQQGDPSRADSSDS